MELIHIVGLSCVVALLVLVLREHHPTIAFLVVLFAAVIVLLLIFHHVRDAFVLVRALAAQAGVDEIFFTTMIKMIGIAYVAEIGAHIMRDAQLASMAAHIELAGKVLLLVMAMPILTTVIQTIAHILPFGAT
ncbi:MAG: stage III sporulation protein AD [Paenibacillaceae bacterium]|jgi:stage III sporulation protein AD|nr:stage III sporulation protein AD [Paenibacillaceae bacterium]